MRILIAGGGTGGHIIPALAIADALRDRHSAEIRFVGTERGLEVRLVPQAGYRLELISVGQLNRVSLRTRVKTLFKLPAGVLHCMRLQRTWRPDVVIGVGGYASGPAMLAAVLLRIPTLAFEPNAVPGMTNRLIGKRVSAAAVNFAPARSYFRNAEVTGIPVRAGFFSVPPPSPESAPKLLVLGGSQGARGLNRIMPEIAKRLLERVPGLTLVHQAGARHEETAREGYRESGAPAERWTVHAFLEDMPAQFAQAHLILARSGASTVAEITAAGKPSVLVPFPMAADDHQRKNAEVLVAAGAAVMLLEESLTAEILLDTLCRLLADPDEWVKMGNAARRLAHPEAAQRIAEMAAKLAAGRAQA